MQRAVAIDNAQLVESIFMGKSSTKRNELVRSLQEIETSMLLGNVELGLGAVRELINSLYHTKAMRKTGNVVMESNNNNKPEVLAKAERLCESEHPLRIYTMGRFSVVVNGKPIVFRTKAQKRPMDLLKSMIALGGRGIAKSQLTELLWPDSAGDASISVINTTLSRLRKLIGKDAIHTENGCISLNPDYCRVDCWEFERLLNIVKTPEEVTPQSIKCILKLYQGHFMEGEEHGWLVTRREKLRNKLLHVCARHAKFLMGNQEYKSARDIFEKCIEIDDLNEEFYINLMQCQIQLNQTAEAVQTYRRCHKIITTLLGTSPSVECQKLYLSVLDE